LDVKNQPLNFDWGEWTVGVDGVVAGGGCGVPFYNKDLLEGFVGQKIDGDEGVLAIKHTTLQSILTPHVLHHAQ